MPRARIPGFEPIATFGLVDVVATYETWSRQFAGDQKRGEAAALTAVARVKGAGYPQLLVKICCAIADADGGFDAEERKALNGICAALALDPAKFGVANAP
jgi:tellurite resistance protein TerB